MKKCAAEQGHGRAALEYALHIRDESLSEAVKYLYLGAKAGDESSAGRLADGFNGPATDNEIDYLGLTKDEERSQRYDKIAHVLSDYSCAHPSVPELDEIVPLPPAKLPHWDGKIKWLEDFKANIPPEKPSETLVKQLAEAKGLDPARGRPCPQSGLWQCVQPQATPHQLSRRAGQTMPAVLVPNPRSLWHKLKGEPAELAIDSEWALERLG